MPNAQIKSYSEKYDVPMGTVEGFWKKASEEYGDNYAAISGTVKKMCQNYKKGKNESNIQKSLAILQECGCGGDKKKCKCDGKCGGKCKCKEKGLKEDMDAKVECIKCGWKGKVGEAHTDRGGHNFLCPKCGGQVKDSK